MPFSLAGALIVERALFFPSTSDSISRVRVQFGVLIVMTISDLDLSPRICVSAYFNHSSALLTFAPRATQRTKSFLKSFLNMVSPCFFNLSILNIKNSFHLINEPLVMGRENECQLEFLIEFFKELNDFLRSFGIKVGRGFIGQNEFWTSGNGPGN